LSIPIFFRIYFKFLFISELNLPVISILIIYTLFILIVGVFIGIYGHSNDSIEAIEKFDVIDAIINNH